MSKRMLLFPTTGQSVLVPAGYDVGLLAPDMVDDYTFLMQQVFPRQLFRRSTLASFERTWVAADIATGALVATASAGSRHGLPAVRWVACLPDHREKGLASCLVRRVVNYFVGTERLAVMVEAEPATDDVVALYKSVGFEAWPHAE